MRRECMAMTLNKSTEVALDEEIIAKIKKIYMTIEIWCCSLLVCPTQQIIDQVFVDIKHL